MAFASYTPTQIGRIALPCTSLRTTMGMFVTGSIIRPRIFISTSIGPSRKLADVLAEQTVGTCVRHSNLNVLSQKLSLRRNEIQDAIAGCVTRPLILP